MCVTVCLLASACTREKGAGAETGSESTGASESATDAAPQDPTDGETPDDASEGAGETDVATSFGDTETTPSVLEACELADPCATITVYCDYDGCANAMPDDATVCAWTRLRDNQSVRLHIAETYTGDLNKVAAVVGDPGRTLLLDGALGATSTLRTCKLVEPAFFQACIDAPDHSDHCYQTDRWMTDCEVVQSLECPGA